MNYKQAMEYIESTYQYGSVLGLENIIQLLKRLENPDDQLKFIHIAGTNGKGSTAAYLATILGKAGYLVGRYISPTIQDYREKIQITKKETTFITKEAVSRHLTKIRDVINTMLLDGLAHPTPFEIETAMAMLYFVEQQCDLVVLEVGMGGRFDATNSIKTVICSVLTAIGMDHMQVLGNTIEEIAYEKAGIIKESIPVVSYPQLDRVKQIIEQECLKKHAPCKFVDFTNLSCESYRLEETMFHYKQYEQLKISLLGEHQVKNAVVAIEVIQILNHLGYCIKEEQVKEGLAYTKWLGRLEILQRQPMVIIDGAHNIDAALALRESIKFYFTNRKIIYIMGILADKEYEKIVRETVDLANCVITITPNNNRGLSSDLLAEEVKKVNQNVIDAKTIEHAINLAFRKAKKEDIILIFGSLSFLKEVYKSIESTKEE